MVQLKLSLLTVPAQVLLGLGLAVFLKERIKNSWLVEIARSTLLVPMVIPPIVAALIWKIIFTPPVSIFSYVSTQLGFGPLNWLGDPDLALVAIAIAGIWEFFPFSFLLLYAGLISLPEEPYEAALVDGATRWQTFRHVTLPMLMPTISIVLLFRVIDSIRAFPLIFVMTQGGPGFATEPTNFYAYTQAFSYTYIGYSSAMIVVVLDLYHAADRLCTKPDHLAPRSSIMTTTRTDRYTLYREIASARTQSLIISGRSVSAPSDPVGGIGAHPLACPDVLSHPTCCL